MSTSVQVEIKGLDEMASSFKKSPALFVKIFDQAVKKSIIDLLGMTRPWVPIDKGFLRGPGMQTTFEALIGTIENTAPYAVYVHEGTRKMEARPFFDEGLQDAQGDIDKFFDEALQTFNESL